jgi:hypothetical protein
MESAYHLKFSDINDAVDTNLSHSIVLDTSKELLIPITEAISPNARNPELHHLYSHDDINPGYGMKIISIFLCLFEFCGLIEII